MPEIIQPIAGHALFILLLQVAALLILARVLADLMRRIGQPAVIGELLAGIVLGPTVFGHVAPELFAAFFPQTETQFHLLEVIAWLGMVLLLLLTGIETDIRTMRHLGRAAVMASVFGMVIPFASGLAMGWMLPDPFLTDPDNRPIFAAFLATAMAISAMPVIAKILMDLDLIKRDVGIVILSAGVVDDITGWLILSVIAGVAAGGAFSMIGFATTLLSLVMFLLVMRYLAYPAVARAVRYLNDYVDLAGAELTLMLALTFVAAAVTEAIGVHAVFGAFIAGLLIRQIRRIRAESLAALEVFVLAALSPIFFAFVGLKVDLWALTGWQLPVLVISVAVGGKLIGCYIGGRLGRMSHWESLALGFGMNARGAMELIVALIGLSLGLLTQEMYSTIVLVAVVTSFMAPLLLRWALPHIPPTHEEQRRLAAGARGRFMPVGAVRILVPTAGGENALAAIRLAAPILRRDEGQITALYVETGMQNAAPRGWWFRRPSLAGTNLEEHFRRATELVGSETRLSVRRVQSASVSDMVTQQATRDYDLLFVGSSSDAVLRDDMMREIVLRAPIPVVIVRHLFGATDPLPRVLVAFDGSSLSLNAAEFALSYAGAVDGDVTVLHIVEEPRFTSGSLTVPDRRDAEVLSAGRTRHLREQLREQLETAAHDHGARFSVRIMGSGSPGEAIIHESRSGHYDLLVLGAENKMIVRPLFFGQGTGYILERSGCTTAVVVPASE